MPKFFIEEKKLEDVLSDFFKTGQNHNKLENIKQMPIIFSTMVFHFFAIGISAFAAIFTSDYLLP